MKILHVIGRLGMGGDTVTVRTAMNALIENENLSPQDVDYLTHDIGYNLTTVDDIKKEGHKVIILPGDVRKLGPIKYYQMVKKVLKRNGPYDIIHVHTSLQSGIVLKAAFDCGIPQRICHAHTNSIQRKTYLINKVLFTPLLRSMLNKYSNKKAACGIMAGKFLFGREKDFTVLKNGIDLDKYRTCKKEDVVKLKKELGIPDYAYIVGHVGRFSDMKNHRFILRLAEQLKNILDIYFVLVGDGENFDEIQKSVKKEKLKCILPGRRSDIPVFMEMFDLQLIPSLPGEGFSITMLEAEAAGCPCLVADTLPDDADMGLGLVKFLPLDNIEMWKEIIVNKSLQKKEKKICIEKVEKAGYDKKTSTAEWFELYMR